MMYYSSVLTFATSFATLRRATFRGVNLVRTAQVIGRNLTLLDDQSLLLAQWLERGSYEPNVAGSIPA